jgi:hypothetical protein
MPETLHADGLNAADVITYGYRSDRWNFVEGEALAGIVAKLNKEQNRYVISPTNSRVVWRTLLFYPGATLVRVTDLSWRPHGLTLYFVGLRGQYRRLDGSRRFLHFLNEHVPLKLSAQTVAEYLRFYCFFMRHQGRPFLLAEKPEDLGLYAPPPSEALLEQITPLLHPVTILKEDPAEGYQLSAIVRFSNALFDCRFQVSPAGHVRMLEDRELEVSLSEASGHNAAKAWVA